MNILTIGDFRRAITNGPYAWPGGYPCFFLMADGEALSFKAAKENRREILFALSCRDVRPHDDWLPIAVEINWEDSSLMCAHTGESIETAYKD